MVKLESSANIPTAAALSANALPALLPCGCASFRCPPPQRRALRRQGAPFSPGSGSQWRRRAGWRGGGIGETLGFARRRCAFRSVRACARLVVFQLYPKSKLYSLHRSLARSPPLSLPLPPSTDIHSSATARSSFRAIASARCMTSGGEGRGGGETLRGGWFIPCVLDLRGEMSAHPN